MALDNLPIIPGAGLIPPLHGADLYAAAKRYGIPVSDWLDLSTGINPRAYPLPIIDALACQHLPHGDADLVCAAKNYYAAAASPIAAAGSQVFIQWLPLVRAQLTQRRNRIAVPVVGYSEHAFRWQWAGHELVYYDPRVADSIEKLIEAEPPDVLVVINAHNPFGIVHAPERLLTWRAHLEKTGGWLIVDEAFIDPTPACSVAMHTDLPGLIVLRSLGKFFGLAGVRCGFALCNESIAAALRVALGPWGVSGPTLQIAEAALRDNTWQCAMRNALPEVSAANAEMLRGVASLREKTWWPHTLFNSVELPAEQAIDIEDRLARSGIRVRRIELDAGANLLRFGLVDPSDSASWQRFAAALKSL